MGIVTQHRHARATADVPVGGFRWSEVMRPANSPKAVVQTTMERLQGHLAHWEGERDRLLVAFNGGDPQAQQPLANARRMVQKATSDIAEEVAAEHHRTRERDRIERELLIADLRAPPCLQTLVEECGGYDRISAERWARFDRAMAEWRARINTGDHIVQAMRLHRQQRGETVGYSEVRR